jgi:hypothetical protein
MAEQRKWDTWPAVVSNSKHVAQMLEWLRWKTGGKVQLVIAIGANSVAVARDDRMRAEDLIETLRVEQDTIAELLRYLQATNLPSGAKMRPDGR